MDEDQARERLARMNATIAENETVLARLNAHLQAMIPLYIEEITLTPQIAVTTTATLTLNANRDTFFKCTGIYVSVPINTTAATLQLGNQFFLPLQNTTTLLSPVQKILTSTDIRQLTLTTGTTAGQAYVWLWGEAIPKYGKL